MSTGKLRFGLWSAGILLVLMLLSYCDRGKPNSDDSARQVKTPVDFQELLSGIWYHSPGETIASAMEDRFSWGTTRYDYMKALRIDLLGGQRFLGFADATWNDVCIEVDGTNASVIKVHLRQKENPAREEVLVTVERIGVISLAFAGNVDTAETRRIAGRYYKAIDPHQ
jgi:hypothetical protein